MIESPVFFHGTSSNLLPILLAEGLTDPFLTDDPERATHYAECAAEDVGGDPVVLKVQVPDLGMLRYDRAAMDEPVMASEEARDAAWAAAEAAHPEWISGEYLLVPEIAWQVSWAGVGSVRAVGRLHEFTVASAAAGLPG